ncbi:MAG TPA: type II secretion system F family protein [Verrucomicrobiae bacterium]|jgi:type II secretory pathway component PulF|nr:type II secretion system F family protein [Verrucomicrobiae bacterium]
MTRFGLFNFFCCVAGVAFAAYYVSGLPLRRQERARFLLDQIESALSQGRTVESYIVSLARTGDPAISMQFHLLAAHLESGNSLIDGLARVPRLLPRQVLAMLKVGCGLGDVRRVLPACRQLLQDGISQSRALINYEVAFAFIINPLLILLPVFLSTKIVPVFKAIHTSLGLHPSHALERFVRWAPFLVVIQLLAVLTVYLFAVLFLGGPRVVSWIGESLSPLADWIHLRSPWRRKRLQRDFSAMLALLLDAGIPEEQSVTLAAASTANSAFIRTARKVVEQLRAGAKLPIALEMIDSTGEFRWRIENGARGAGGFFRALKGWHESLAAAAFQQEQAAAQAITTGLVLLNAASVALAAFGFFQAIAQLTPLQIK